MESIKNIFKIGKGPSSSHTMGPKKAAEIFRDKYPDAERFVVTLYGSLAATGRGHLTDTAIVEALKEIREETIVEIEWLPEVFLPQHSNGMRFKAYHKDGQELGEWTTFSIGGGDISDSGNRENEANETYPHSNMADILDWCRENGTTFWEYVEQYEDNDIYDYLREVWGVMTNAIKEGLEIEGVINGGLNLRRRASSYNIRAQSYQGSMQRRALTFAYALAVSEQNATGGTIVTAPTCGSCGVLPAVLYLDQQTKGFSDKKILYALATAGVIGTIVKRNASISGAEVGCQGEIGTACSMSAAAGAQLYGGSPTQIEYAASMGMEHFLGLTCDPINGLVQVPCIERNAFAAARAKDVIQYAIMSDGTHLVHFDVVIEAMKRTGHDIPNLYKETAEGGLASLLGK